MNVSRVTSVIVVVSARMRFVIIWWGWWSTVGPLRCGAVLGYSLTCFRDDSV